MTKRYRLLVIGTGTAATVAATRMRQAGWSVAVVDNRPFGGTCALRGCDPKKVLMGGAEAADHARRMFGKGIAGEIRVDWPALMSFKRTFTDPVSKKREERYAELGIDAYHGEARFTGANTVEAEGEALEADHILIAVGAEPVKLPIPGEQHLITSDGFLELESLPRRIVLVGGGYIAAEFSHIAARAGAEVTVLQRGERMLTHFDSDLVGWLMERSRDVGIVVRTQTNVEAIEKTDGGYHVSANAGGRKMAFDADVVVHAAGRAPALSGLDLEAGNVAVEKGRLKLNEHLQSVSNSAVYAAGDAAQMGPPLTPVSSHDAKVVVANLLEGNPHKPDYAGVPSVAFTIPPIAAVGLGEAEAREQGRKLRINSEMASGWFTARHSAEPTYGFKVLIDEETDRILGAHIVGPHAEETINVFALAVRHGLTAEQLKTTMFAYPTAASDIDSML
jgi:glutathione reductase (NADPH)